MSTPGPTASELVFSDQANHGFSSTLGALKRSTLSIRNRLLSIQEDAAFAQTVASAYHRPLVANERCGSWYINPDWKGGSVYFKSTDGHTGVWKFSSRRLNLHLLEIIGKNDGCIIVDSTRRGKRMPDALSKTIPIWCSVINRFLFPDQPDYHKLHAPPQVVSQSEHAQISALLPSFLSALDALNIPVDAFKAHVSKPIRPVWVTPDSYISQTDEIFEAFHPVICCTVSRRVLGGELSEGGYIQGAGDDTENWAHGLTPSIFWANAELLVSSLEHDLPGLIKSVLQRNTEASAQNGGSIRCVRPTSCLLVAPISTVATGNLGTNVCVITLFPKVTPEDTWRTSTTRLDVGLGPFKLGSRKLRTALPTIVEFARGYWYNVERNQAKRDIIVACETGNDLAIGIALALLCLFFNDNGELLGEEQDKASIDKSFIRHRLGLISAYMPDANANRATLQSVNSFLMGRY